MAAANGWTTKSSLSADDRFVTFHSDANNLVGGDINDSTDVFVHDCQNGQTRRVSLASGGSQATIGAYWSAISADGQVVVFQSDSTNLVSDDTNERKDIFVQDWGIQEATPVQADFSASPLSGVDTLTVTFTHHISGEFTTSLWFFGDGETSLQPSPTHTYSTPGVYNVTLFASGPGGTDILTRNAYIVVRGARSRYLPIVIR